MRQVYFNLHRRGWSIKNPATGLVENKGTLTTYVVLKDVTFKVSEAGRQRVILEQRKNVHSFAVGDVSEGVHPNATVPVSYNPYKAGHFVRTDTGEAIHGCKVLVMGIKLVEIFIDGRPTGRIRRVPVVKAEL
jgi:hypothetical protein